jgi:hypothetical protein
MSISEECLASVVLDHEEWVTVWRQEDGSLGLTVLIDGIAGFTLSCAPDHAANLAGGLLGVRAADLNAAPNFLVSVVLHGGEWLHVARSGDGYLDLAVPVPGGLPDGTHGINLHCSPEQAAALAGGLLGL